jgi:hypothetical protein
MQTRLVKVTQEIIDAAIAERTRDLGYDITKRCVIAKAIIETFGENPRISCGQGAAYLSPESDNEGSKLLGNFPEEATQAAKDFDNWRYDKLAPFEFELELDL